MIRFVSTIMVSICLLTSFAFAAQETATVVECSKMTESSKFPLPYPDYLRYLIRAEHTSKGLRFYYAGPTMDDKIMIAAQMKVTKAKAKIDARTGKTVYSFTAKKREKLSDYYYWDWKVQGQLILDPRDPAHAVFRHKARACDSNGPGLFSPCREMFPKTYQKADEEIACKVTQETVTVSDGRSGD